MKKFLVFLLSLTICLTPSLTFAGAAEKWDLIENVYDKSKNTVKVEARKIAQTAANSARYKVEVPVNPSTLGASLKVFFWTGVAVAGVQAMLEGLGWVIDTGSKTIKRPKEMSIPNNPQYQYVWACQLGGAELSPNATEACTKMLKIVYPNDFHVELKECVAHPNGINFRTCTYIRQATENSPKTSANTVASRQVNKYYDPNYQNPNQEYEILSDAQLGNEVMGNGENKNVISTAISDAYNPNSGTQAGNQTDSALDSAPPQPQTEPNGDSKPKPNVDTDGDGKDDAYDPNKPTKGDEFQLPNFCDWAVTVCEWYTQYKTDSKNVETHRVKELSFWEKVQDYFNWSREPPDKDNSDNDVPVKTPEAFDNSVFSKDRFAVSRQCPIPEQHTISLSGVSVNFSFDMTPLCQVLILARPALVACSYLYAAYIVIGAARNG